MQISFYDHEGETWLKLFQHQDPAVIDRLINQLRSSTELSFWKLDRRLKLNIDDSYNEEEDCYNIHYVIEADDETTESSVYTSVADNAHPDDYDVEKPIPVDDGRGLLHYLAFSPCGYGACYLVRISSDGNLVEDLGWSDGFEDVEDFDED